MAGELVETTRLWAATSRASTPSGPSRRVHLVKRSYSEPRWSAKQGSAVATERVTLYGVPIVLARTVGYARVDAAESRHLFIQRALVEGDWTTRHRFFHDNAALVERLSELEARTRRRDLIVGDETLYAFYDKRVPADVVSARHFDSWWKKAGRQDPTLLTFTEDLLLSDRADQVDTDAYPTSWRRGSLELAVTYRFEPGSPEDGVTVHVPVEVLNRVTASGFDWQVPGMRDDLVTALIRSLPQGIRRLLVPAPEHAGALVTELRERGLGPGDGQLTDILGRVVRETRGVAVGPPTGPSTGCRRTCGSTSPSRTHAGGSSPVVPTSTHCARRPSPSFAGRCPAPVRRWSGPACAGGSSARSPKRSPRRRRRDAWSRGTPRSSTTEAPRGPSRCASSPTRAEAVAEHRLGVRRLLLLNVAPPWKQVLARLTNARRSWPSRTTRTGRFPRSSTTVSPARSTRSLRNGCRGRSARRRRSPRPSTRCGPTWPPEWSRWSAWSSRSSPRTSRRRAASMP